MRPPRAARALLACVATVTVVGGAVAAGASGRGQGKGPGRAKEAARGRGTPENEARAFLETVTALLLPVETASNRADWQAAVDVTAEHTGQRTGANKAYAALVGAPFIVEKTKAFLSQAEERRLDEVTVRQLKKLLFAAANYPGTIPDVVTNRVEAEARQSAILDGYAFCLQPRPNGACAETITANQIDDRLRSSRDLAQRERLWSVSKEIGRPLKPGLINLVALRNRVAREMGYPSFFALKVADYDMTVPEMMALLEGALSAVQPLFDDLHCWARHEMAARYRVPAPKQIPAHWIGNRWAQSWPGLVDTADLNPWFKKRSAEWIAHTAEDFYVSLGFPKLPESFWARSDLFPVPPGAARKKNTHASAWHIDRDRDVRSLMSIEPNEQWFGTAHHELGHIYYFTSYSTPEVPPLLREGANRAFHEAVGELIKLASEQTPYLRKIGVLPADKAPDPMGSLLRTALDSVVFLEFSAGTMSHFERDLYEAELAPSEWQKRWWEYVSRYQGVIPPGPRGEALCDACTKTHINDDPGEYYDYALASLIKFQLHDAICTKVLKQDPRACDYSGHPEVGELLRGILSLGASHDWRKVMRDATGEDISPRAMLAYFQPLTGELARRNAGRDCSR